MKVLTAFLISCTFLLTSCSGEFTGFERKTGAIILIVVMVGITLIQGDKKTGPYN